MLEQLLPRAADEDERMPLGSPRAANEDEQLPPGLPGTANEDEWPPAASPGIPHERLQLPPASQGTSTEMQGGKQHRHRKSGGVTANSCNWPRASPALVSNTTGQYDEIFTLSPTRSCTITFGAASCTLITSPYQCPCLVSFLPF